MITTEAEYKAYLARIYDQHTPPLAIFLPSTERIYNVNLYTRQIETPDFLSVRTDHEAETIYFKVPRFFNHMDLSNTNCIISYVNADGEGRIYPVPYYDITTCVDENAMLIPWCIEGEATKTAGKVQYSIKFYKLNEETNEILYSLSTMTSTSQVLYGLESKIDEESTVYKASDLDAIYNRIAEVQRQAEDVYWIDL